jgi:hypothetical protein
MAGFPVMTGCVSDVPQLSPFSTDYLRGQWVVEQE